MKRILVVLLVLSVAVGVFAQESGWGTMEGEAGLFTKLNFAINPASEATADGDWGGDFWLGITWSKNFGPWAVTLPLRLENGYFGTGYDPDADDDADGIGWDTRNTSDTTAKVVYTGLGDNLTVEVPFWFQWDVWNASDNGNFTGDYQYYRPAHLAKVGGNGYAVGDAVPAGWTNYNNNGYALYGDGLAIRFGDKIDAKGNITEGTGAPKLMSQMDEVRQVGSASGVLPLAGGNIGVNVNYGSDDKTSAKYTPFGFKFGFDNLMTSAAITKAGGYYHFMNGVSQFYISRGGAYATEWWRASDYVLNPEFKGNTGVPVAADHAAAKPFEFHWENIEDNGIAYRFFIMPDVLQIGLSFATSGTSSDNAAPFRVGGNNDLPGSLPDNYGNFGNSKGIFEDNLLYDFIMHPVFGVKYDNDTLGVSAMVGLEIPYNRGSTLGFDNDVAAKNSDYLDYTKNGKRNDSSNYTEIETYVAFGAYYQLNEQIKINGDMSAAFGDYYLDNGRKNVDGRAIFNAGLELSYTGDPIWAGLGFKVIDLLEKDQFRYGIDYAVGFNVARDGYGWTDEGEGPWIGLYGHINGEKVPTRYTDIGLFFDAGWKNLALTDVINFSISAGLGLDIAMLSNDSEIATSFYVEPIFDWAVFSNGSIQFKYKLGSTNLNDKYTSPYPLLDTNKLTTTFKWTL